MCMIMNDDLQLQITEYEGIDDFFEKVRFVETMVAYYANRKENPCYMYWKATLDNLYWFGFNYY